MCAAAANIEEIDATEIGGTFDLSVMKRFNMYFLTKYVLCSVPAQINFCMEVGLLPKKRTCTYCKRDLKLVVENRKDHTTPVVYRCYNRGCKKCNKYVSISDGTVFEGSHLSVGMVLRLIILYIDNINITSYKQIRNQCFDEEDVELSNETVNDWLTYLREVQLEALVRTSQTKIGGPNCTVEIDDSQEMF